LEQHWELVKLEAAVQKGVTMGADIVFIGSLVIVGMLRIEYNIVCRETGWERETVDVGMMQSAVHAGLSVCCTRCMLFSV
jgi:hypothetical protein